MERINSISETNGFFNSNNLPTYYQNGWNQAFTWAAWHKTSVCFFLYLSNLFVLNLVVIRSCKTRSKIGSVANSSLPDRIGPGLRLPGQRAAGHEPSEMASVYHCVWPGLLLTKHNRLPLKGCPRLGIPSLTREALHELLVRWTRGFQLNTATQFAARVYSVWFIDCRALGAVFYNRA